MARFEAREYRNIICVHYVHLLCPIKAVFWVDNWSKFFNASPLFNPITEYYSSVCTVKFYFSGKWCKSWKEILKFWYLLLGVVYNSKIDIKKISYFGIFVILRNTRTIGKNFRPKYSKWKRLLYCKSRRW